MTRQSVFSKNGENSTLFLAKMLRASNALALGEILSHSEPPERHQNLHPNSAEYTADETLIVWTIYSLKFQKYWTLP